ncbi:MAG: hypothetical protein HC817_14780, partial [Saprospiraceae bacterium]|nr:hypothetical protein [Saprospiraceae bacterium]
LFTATFSPVGTRRGNYRQVPTASNGRVYEWVAPDSVGIPQGDFEPIKKLTPPNRFQMWSLGADYQFFTHTKISTELSFSNFDRNLFSALGDSSNLGGAVFSKMNNAFFVDKKENWRLEADTRFEATLSNFRPLNPYRPAEFARDWNVPSPTENRFALQAPNAVQPTIGNVSQTPAQTPERFFNSLLKLMRKDWFSITYDFGRYIRAFQYNGLKNAAKFDFQRKNWSLVADFNDLNTEGGIERTRFSRPRVELSKVFKNNIKISALGEREKNQRFDTRLDTLTRASFYFDAWKVFAEKKFRQSGNFLNVNYAQRYDYQPFMRQFERLSRVDELGASGSVARGENTSLIWTLTYRNLKVVDTSRTSLRPQETYLGRVEYYFSYLKNALAGNTLYEIGSGQEQRIEYQYVRVNKGEGQFIWRDRNTDEQAQLDEFEIAPFQDQADYLRVTLLTNQFVKTNNVSFAQSLRFEPQKSGVKKVF